MTHCYVQPWEHTAWLHIKMIVAQDSIKKTIPSETYTTTQHFFSFISKCSKTSFPEWKKKSFMERKWIAVINTHGTLRIDCHQCGYVYVYSDTHSSTRFVKAYPCSGVLVNVYNSVRKPLQCLHEPRDVYFRLCTIQPLYMLFFWMEWVEFGWSSPSDRFISCFGG